jgi:hypothetical protein
MQYGPWVNVLDSCAADHQHQCCRYFLILFLFKKNLEVQILSMLNLLDITPKF